MAGLVELLRSKEQADAKRYGGLVGLLLSEDDSRGYNPFLKQTPGAEGNNPMAQNTGGQPIPPAPHWVNSLMGLGESVVNGFMAPSNALAGKYDQIVIDPETGKVLSMIDPRLMDDAAAMAGLLTTGSMPIPKPVGSLGIFGGKMAATADQAALAKAEQMAASGASRDAIWNATGWFKGVDGQWRFEIPDNASKVNANAASFSDNSNRVPMSLAMKHDKLYAAYPDIGQMTASMKLKAGGLEGSYAVPRTVGGRLIEGISVEAPTATELRSGILHEKQHAVQTRENFAEGGNPDNLGGGATREEVFSAAKAAYEDAAKISDEDLLAELLGTPKSTKPKPEMKPWDELTDRQKLEWLDVGRQRIYRTLAGEVEARNVQYRADMTPEQRRAKAPWLTQDVPDDMQIVRMRALAGL